MDSILEPFEKIRIFSQGGLRAPHKPILLLYALARLRADGRDDLLFTDIERPVGEIIRSYAPPGSKARVQDPFRYLESDGIWQMRAADREALLGPGNAARISELRRQGVTGGFTAVWLQRFHDDPGLVDWATLILLERNFPLSLHEEILDRVGLELGQPPDAGKRKHNPKFISAVRETYFGQCAMCEFDLRFGGDPVGLEAAHIKWHAMGGPDEVHNGLALCALHHRLFDRGAITVDHDLAIRVSTHVEGSAARNFVDRFHGRPIGLPRLEGDRPAPDMLAWHHRQVFR